MSRIREENKLVSDWEVLRLDAFQLWKKSKLSGHKQEAANGAKFAPSAPPHPTPHLECPQAKANIGRTAGAKYKELSFLFILLGSVRDHGSATTKPAGPSSEVGCGSDW